MTRILWIAVADARGHLMRAHLARRLLAADGIQVDVATTTAEGVRFLHSLGTPARCFGRGYSLAFDDRQSLDRGETERRMLRYLFGSLAADLRRLDRLAFRYALVVNDSFHPALLLAPLFRSRARIVNVYGEHMLEAVANHLADRPLVAKSYASSVRRVCALAYARIEHTLAREVDTDPKSRHFRLAPLIDAPSRSREEVRAKLAVPSGKRLAVVYLNPHFRDPALAAAIERALDGFALYAVGEGFADRPGWRASDPRLVDAVHAADLVVSAPGMGTLAQVRAFGTPMIALVTDQPEQRMNLSYLDPERSAIVDAARIDQLAPAAARVSSTRTAGSNVHQQRAAWRHAFWRMLNGIDSKELIGDRNEQPARWWSERRETGSDAGAPALAPRGADLPALGPARPRHHLVSNGPGG